MVRGSTCDRDRSDLIRVSLDRSCGLPGKFSFRNKGVSGRSQGPCFLSCVFNNVLYPVVSKQPVAFEPCVVVRGDATADTRALSVVMGEFKL